MKRASAFGAKPVLAEAIELYHKRSICSHFHLSVLIGARIGAERLQADDCSTAGDGTQGYSHLRGIRPEAAALGEDVGCSAAAKLSNEEGHLVRRITPLLAPSTTDCTKGPHGVSHHVFGSKPLLTRRGTSVRGEPSTSWRPLLITINQHGQSQQRRSRQRDGRNGPFQRSGSFRSSISNFEMTRKRNVSSSAAYSQALSPSGAVKGLGLLPTVLLKRARGRPNRLDVAQPISQPTMRPPRASQVALPRGRVRTSRTQRGRIGRRATARRDTKGRARARTSHQQLESSPPPLRRDFISTLHLVVKIERTNRTGMK